MLIPLVQLSQQANETTKQGTQHIMPGSVIALRRKEPDRIILDFEGDIYGRYESDTPTLEARTEYAKQAGGRAAASYPTVARVILPNTQPAEFLQDGWIDAANGHVTWFATSEPFSAFPAQESLRR